VLNKDTRCSACSLLKIGSGYAKGAGSGDNKVLLLGEALGAREAAIGMPFVGDAGVQLNRTLQRVQSGRDNFRIANVVNCRPPKNWLEGAPWETDAINNCTTYFHDELDKYKPKVIVPMGNVPTNFLIGSKEKRGGIEDRRGYVYPCVINTPLQSHSLLVVPTYHPSFVMRGNHNLMDVQAIDIKRALRCVKEGYTEPEYKYVEHPTDYDLQVFYGQCKTAASNGKWLIADIETPKSGGATEDEYGEIIDTDIIRISFSIEPHTAITIPWTERNFFWIEAILKLSWSHTVFWNQEFDVPRLQSKGCVLGKVLDAMYCLAGSTKLRLANGTTKTIKEIVEGKQFVKLLGMNEAGEIISVNIVAHHKTVVKNQRWLRVKTDGSRQSIYLTPDHKVYTWSGWKEADKLTVGDLVPVPRLGSIAMIHGTLLGDGSITDDHTLILTHGKCQEVWAGIKARHMGAVLKEYDNLSGYNKGGRRVQFTKAIPKYMKKVFYPKGKKVLVLPTSFAALAVWYCDDGSWTGCTTEKALGRVVLACHGYTETERNEIAAWLKAHFGDPVSVHGGFVYVRRAARDKFFSAVAEFIPPCMEYKLPMQYRGAYKGYWEVPKPQWAKVEYVGSYCGRGDTTVRYCVTVDHPTHRFFTDGGLVSNCWHFLQSDLPKGLGYVSTFFTELSEWKSLSQEFPEYYSCKDSDATIQCANRIRELLDQQGRFQMFLKHYVDLQPFVVSMAASGVCVDPVQQEKFRSEVEKELGRIDDEIQQNVPEEIRPFKARKSVPCSAVIGEAGGPVKDRGVWGVDSNGEWGIRTPFLYGSPKQVLRYIKFRGHPVSTNYKTGKETTSAEVIDELADKYPDDPLYPRVLGAREYRKIMGQYIDGYAPDPDGRVRTHFNRKPSTWRYNSERPNVQNVLKRSELAGEYRKQFVAGELNYD
jgi:uracil-DNA glycosylase family 4